MPLRKYIRSIIQQEFDNLSPELCKRLHDSVEEDLRRSIQKELDGLLREALHKAQEAGEQERKRQEALSSPLTRSFFWSDSEPHWQYLERFTFPHSIDWFDERHQRDWREEGMRQTLEQAASTFLRAGLIEELKLHPIEQLAKFKRQDIVDVCTELGIEDVRGPREDLARAIWEHDQERVKDMVRGPAKYVLTEYGVKVIAAKYRHPMMIAKAKELEEE